MKNLLTEEERNNLKSGVRNILDGIKSIGNRSSKRIDRDTLVMRNKVASKVVALGLKIGAPTKTEPSITYHPGGNGDEAEVVQ